MPEGFRRITEGHQSNCSCKNCKRKKNLSKILFDCRMEMQKTDITAEERKTLQRQLDSASKEIYYL
jgi:phosphoribosyl 1,2-cyclic phosphodiesterase